MRLINFLSGAIILLFVFSLPLEGKRILMFPLSAQEVYRILKAAGKEDAVPEGRVVSQGVAAVTGFALGLAKGIGGTALLGAAALNGLALSANRGSGCCQQQSQEVCFTSRSLNEIYDGEEEDAPEGRQTGTGTTSITNNDHIDTPTTLTTIGSPTTLDYANPTTEGTTDTGGSATMVDDRDGTGTQSGTTTQTGSNGAVNCVVVQQPCSCNSG